MTNAHGHSNGSSNDNRAENTEPLSGRKRPNDGMNHMVTAHLQKKRKIRTVPQDDHSQSVQSPNCNKSVIYSSDYAIENTNDYRIVDDDTTHTTSSQESLNLGSDQDFLTIRPFVYLEEWNLVVCKECRTAGEICSHLCNRTHLRRFTNNRRREIMSQVFNIPGILKG